MKIWQVRSEQQNYCWSLWKYKIFVVFREIGTGITSIFLPEGLLLINPNLDPDELVIGTEVELLITQKERNRSTYY